MLQQIFEFKKEEVTAAEKSCPIAVMREKAEAIRLNHAFLEAISPAGPRSGPSPAKAALKLIAEVKKASPSQGLIRADFDPAAIARIYGNAGAHALSVLTDARYFQGHPQNIAKAREACGLPILRKDFIASPYQVYETKALGADAILLIVAGLDPHQLKDLYALATEIGLDVLVEVHAEAELETALGLDPKIIGINNRDLATFKVDLAVSEKLIPKLPNGTVAVCESALSTSADVARAARAGASALLIGTAFCAAPDIFAKVKEMMQW